MSTFLEGVQDLASEAAVAASPSTVVSQTGESLRLVTWYQKAYTEIQNRHGGLWRWLRRDFTFDTTASDDTYEYGDVTDVDAGAVISRFNRWRINDYEDPPKAYLTSSGVGGEYWLNYVEWEDFKRIYKIGTAITGQPAHITVDPRNQIVLGPTPDAIYTITGEFYRSKQSLTANADTPEMPEQFHDLIVYRALEKYARYEEQELLLRMAQREGMRLMRQLESDQFPRFKMAGPLA